MKSPAKFDLLSTRNCYNIILCWIIDLCFLKTTVENQSGGKIQECKAYILRCNLYLGYKKHIDSFYCPGNSQTAEGNNFDKIPMCLTIIRVGFISKF